MPIGKKYGGRQKGTPNKKTEDLQALCEKEKVHPFQAMLRLAKQLEEFGQTKEAFDSFEKICQYIYPKRKAVEVSTQEQEGFQIVIKDYTGSVGNSGN